MHPSLTCSTRVVLVACGVALAIAVAAPLSAPLAALAASPTHTPTPAPTATPYPTYTPQATYTPAPTHTPYPSPTVIPSPSPIPQGTDPHNPSHYCTGLLNWCPDLSGLFNAVGGVINGAIVAVFSPLEHVFSDAYASLVAPFQRDLTYTPNIPKETSWAGLRTFKPISRSWRRRCSSASCSSACSRAIWSRWGMVTSPS